jgi:phosphate transport system substrate-binding protein
MLRRLTGIASAAAIALTLGLQAVLAEPLVTLSSRDGATKVEGELVGYDGTTFTLRTALGTMSIRADQVTCEGEGCPAPPVEALEPAAFTLAGSYVMGDRLIPAIVDGFAESLDADLVTEVGGARNTEVFQIKAGDGSDYASITVEANGTETAFAALNGGSAAFALAGRRIIDADPGAAGLRETPAERIVALDGMVVLVHPDNPVGTLSLDQIAGVFAGQITDWSQLGGIPGQISLYLPDERSGTRVLFDEMVMRPRRLELADSAERLDRHTDLADLVSVDPGGIGLTSIAFARAARMLAIRRECGLISAPDRFSIKSEEYPLTRRLYLYGDTATQPVQARALAEYAVSDAAQPFIANAGFVDRDILTQSIAAQGDRIANSITSEGEFSLPVFREMLTELKGAERLSMTFRFTAGSSNLEDRSQSEAERFARLLAGGAYASKEILLVGFTDSVGDFEVNRNLAARRAESVLGTLKAAVADGALNSVPIQVRSYGELTPVGCNETADGRELNRRVEVWTLDRRN